VQVSVRWQVSLKVKQYSFTALLTQNNLLLLFLLFHFLLTCRNIDTDFPLNFHLYTFTTALIFLLAQQPPPPPPRNGPKPSYYRGFTITLRHIIFGRTPLEKWSVRHRYLYLTTHNTHNRQTSMPTAVFEPTIPAGERQQTHALDRATTGIDTVSCVCNSVIYTVSYYSLLYIYIYIYIYIIIIFYWRYNPLCVLAFSVIFFLCALSSHCFLHRLTHIICKSSSVPAIHLFRGLPLVLVPIGFHCNILLSSICITWPSQAILLLFINLTMSACPISSFSS